MSRNHLIALAFTAALASAGLAGWQSAVAGSNAAESTAAYSGPISTWSAYQPTDALGVRYTQADQTSAYNGYDQVYGNLAPAMPMPAASSAQNPPLGIDLPYGAPAADLPTGFTDYLRDDHKAAAPAPSPGIDLPYGAAASELPAGLTDYVRK